jgi:hypothetical protein
MADTKGLMKTRGEYTDAVTEGKTDKSHKDWYEESYGAKTTAPNETPYNARWRNRPLTEQEK